MDKKNLTLGEIANRISSESDESITEEEIIGIISKVATIHKYKAFAYFDTDDIMSEVWRICLTQLQLYEPHKGKGHNTSNSIERWLNKVVRNRLLNLKRDKYSSVNEKYKQARMNIINSLPFDYIDTSRESNNWGYQENFIEGLIQEELNDFIEANLDESLLGIYYDCLSEENVSPYYKGKLRAALLPILEKWREHNGEK